MRAENLTRSLLDQRFVAIHPFRETAGGIPIRRVLRLHFELQPPRLRLAFLQTYGGDRRHRESYTRHPPIVWLMTVTLQNVDSDDLTVVAGYGREGSPHACGIAGCINQRI